MTKPTFRTTTLILVILGIWIGNAGADKTLVEENLAKSLSIKLEDVTIADALNRIGSEAGLRIALSPEAVWKLPDGLDTRLSVTLDGRLGESLTKMLNSFFLRYAVGSDSLTIYPRPELKRIIGRPTAGELKLLKNVYTNAMWVSTSDKEVQDRFVQTAFNAMAGEPVSIMPPGEIPEIGRTMYQMMTKSSGTPHDPNAPKRDPNAPKKDAPLTLASILEAAVEPLDSANTWYIEGAEFARPAPEIRIVSRAEFQRACLDQIIDVSFANEKGESVIRQLATWAGWEVQVSDSDTARALAREITLEVQNVKLVDAMAKALSTLGVEEAEHVEEGVLRIRQAAPAKEASQQPPGETQIITGGYVGKISIPMDGGKYFIEFMLRESDLTDELRQLRQEKIKEILAAASKASQQTK